MIEVVAAIIVFENRLLTFQRGAPKYSCVANKFEYAESSVCCKYILSPFMTTPELLDDSVLDVAESYINLTLSSQKEGLSIFC